MSPAEHCTAHPAATEPTKAAPTNFSQRRLAKDEVLAGDTLIVLTTRDLVARLERRVED